MGGDKLAAIESGFDANDGGLRRAEESFGLDEEVESCSFKIKGELR